MTSTSGDKFEADPKRLSSYDKDGNRLVDVTDATWEARGESGVVSTTSDLIAFERALLIDKTLLSNSASRQSKETQSLPFQTPARRAISPLLAASKPCARKTARAPSMTWRRLALSCRSRGDAS